MPVMNRERVCDRCVWMNVNSCCKAVWGNAAEKLIVDNSRTASSGNLNLD